MVTSVNEGQDVGEPKLNIPDVLPVLPLRGVVVYPFQPQGLTVGQERSVRLVDDAMRGNRLIALASQIDPNEEQVGPDGVRNVGTAARILQLLRRPDGAMLVAVQGLERIRIHEYVAEQPYLTARVEVYPEPVEGGLELEALKHAVSEQFRRLVELSPSLPDELGAIALNIDDPRQLAYLIAGNTPMDLDLRQEILQLDPVAAKLERLSRFLSHEIEVAELGQRIQGQAREEIDKSQREYILREQLRAIQRELGEEDEQQSEIKELREQLEAADLPPEVRKQANRELSRLERIPSASPEHSVIRSYLDWIAGLPWSVSTGAEIDVPRARQILDEDHYDLEKIKDRILEYLAVRKMKADRARVRREAAAADGEEGDESLQSDVEVEINREPILCFVGPPGVGKTSLGQSIARALNRKFIRLSLGGVRDEAEIRGHRRTYIGAMPGTFIQAIRRAEANDPVFMLDEIDKVGSDWRGDPSSALLEVLDPEQNKDFRDNYLDLPFDLSRVMFIATANTLETIPAPLLDRMEVLQLAGYTEEEKLHIARRFLVPKQRRANGLTEDDIVFEDDALRLTARSYTREAGVRNLERQIATLCRKVARQIAEGAAGPIVVDVEAVGRLLGKPIYEAEVAERTDRPGVATGMVYTPVGGEITFIEAARVPSKGEHLILTGQLGDVMKESAQAALTCVRSLSGHLGIDDAAWQDASIHVHVPAGATPKDGPSAGITMATALASLMTGRAVRSDVAMTGEITLRGKVLPIGGLKEKVLGAYRAGIRTIIFPRRNERDLEDIPEELRKELTFTPVDDVVEVLDIALRKATARAA
jgi:ATP-dependent Lon protease